MSRYLNRVTRQFDNFFDDFIIHFEYFNCMHLGWNYIHTFGLFEVLNYMRRIYRVHGVLYTWAIFCGDGSYVIGALQNNYKGLLWTASLFLKKFFFVDCGSMVIVSMPWIKGVGNWHCHMADIFLPQKCLMPLGITTRIFYMKNIQYNKI